MERGPSGSTGYAVKSATNDKKQGIILKESGKLNEAMECYQKALNQATSDEERIEIWELIIHVHTDRMLAACQHYAEAQNKKVNEIDWNWGSHNIPTNYKRPNKDEVLT